jgi:hypothetical protein
MFASLNLNSFDYALAYFGAFLLMYYVYNITPHKQQIDVFLTKYFLENGKLIFTTINEMNEFLRLDYDYSEKKKKEQKKSGLLEEKKEEKKDEKYEDKYLERFKSFPNEYFYTDEEKKLYQTKYEELRVNAENEIRIKLEKSLERLDHLELISSYQTADNDKYILDLYDLYGEEVNNSLHAIYDFSDDEEEKNDQKQIILTKIREDTLYMEALEKHLRDEIKEVSENIEKLKLEVLDENEFKVQALNHALKTRLDTLINDYVIENTPLGNVVMRYNNEKGSFEYFSNNSIPYRYLEPVGRKYVMSYFCKPLFVDLQEELKRAEEKYEREKQLTEEKEQALKNNETKRIFANLKSYNANIIKTTPVNLPTKNRAPSNLPLPPQIKANLPDVNGKTKQILKEHANRYTWEGRFANLSLLKKIDRKQIDKKYAMTFADFKKMQSSVPRK